jgi:UDP-2,3-diacylglucosamine pyrophosphatase LpxH
MTLAMDKALTWKKLSTLWQDPDVKRMDIGSNRYAIISDIHLGDGGLADDFLSNEPALLNALDHYRKHDYALILLGDIEEFWQFDLDAIVQRYQSSVYTRIASFDERRVHRVFGNHDYEWGGFQDPTRKNGAQFSYAEEAIKLEDQSGTARILLLHGHQGSVEADKYAWFSRFFVRLFRGIEPVATSTGIYTHPSATKSQVVRDFERTLYQWARQNQVILICGHSHRAIFASKSYADKLRDKIAELKVLVSMGSTRASTKRRLLVEIDRLERLWEAEKEKGRVIEPTETDREPLPCYFNSGCGLYTDGITTTEIDDDEIRLVKWNKGTSAGPLFEVYASGQLDDYIKQVTAAKQE